VQPDPKRLGSSGQIGRVSFLPTVGGFRVYVNQRWIGPFGENLSLPFDAKFALYHHLDKKPLNGQPGNFLTTVYCITDWLSGGSKLDAPKQ
jgi:hypothetical protein